ncbi:sigma-54-dependent Fis family transcriptional regulator [Halieaceae bacterium IMCC8485]|uniref:Sigma-54-dependent Fis family transcriptional regulator n=2 Tax=Candidatus Seongchinamella marina TaxID=2518990 RepID=A0ABT3T040_9GAMM|nr:sigma-54-dependent Fis family transcriptional regulator [Candidatus Seongchinamella marina]
MLEGYDCPAILVSAEYVILATNKRYQDTFGEVKVASAPHCYAVSHGYSVPCDQAGEDCPLSAAKQSGHKERVLHIHQTPRGKEHVDVEMLPINDDDGELLFFVELLKPVPLASGTVGDVEMAGSSDAFNRMLGKISRVGSSDAAVLLLGESGTGKELAARAIHMSSKRKSKALVTLECAGLTDSLFESELFGHVKGAFTGANYNTAGLVSLADGGTLFLDEIGDVPLSMQIKLLRLLESGTFRAVGSAEVRSSDFRLICATHKNLSVMVEEGTFRRDLFYRINVFPIRTPSLAQRMEDIPILASTLLEKMSKERKFHLTESAVQKLTEHSFKGNIRELRNLLKRATVLADTNLIDKDLIIECFAEDSIQPTQATEEKSIRLSAGKHVDLKAAETNYLNELMAEYPQDKKKVAKIAGISVRSLYRKLELNP